LASCLNFGLTLRKFCFLVFGFLLGSLLALLFFGLLDLALTDLFFECFETIFGCATLFVDVVFCGSGFGPGE
jgi:hypothetical protein